MLGFNQPNHLSAMFSTNHPVTDWPHQATPCDEIDEIMKQEHDTLPDDTLYNSALEFDINSISELLENNSSVPSAFPQPLNVNELTSTFANDHNHLQAMGTSSYASIDISPNFTSLSINNNQYQPFARSNNANLPQYIQSTQQDSSVLDRSYPFEMQTNSTSATDIKRFRSASMNDGPMLQKQNKLDRRLLDPYPLKSPNYSHSFSHQNKLVTQTDGSSNFIWPSAYVARPPSNSFSEFEKRTEYVRTNRNLSSSFSGSSTLHPTRFSVDINSPSQTLFSINQSSKENLISPNRKQSSIVDFPVLEIQDDPSSSPSGTIGEISENEFWSDFEQNSSDQLQNNDITSDDDTVSKNTSETHSSTAPFWQYNVQSKGPKTKRMLYLKERDPHLHREFSDPVYQIKLTQTKGQTLTKLRKGDGNDVTPDPIKLFQLGKQIEALSNSSSSGHPEMYNFDPHVNSNDTSDVKKEKNKIASRACRLRKKAQHEAYKLKLHGLNEEHKTLNDIISKIKLIILKRYQDGQLNPSSNPSLESSLDRLIAERYRQPVAGNSDAYVTAVLSELEPSQSLKQQRSHSLNV